MRKKKMLVLKDLSGRLPYGVFVEDKVVGRSFDKDGNVAYYPVVYDWSYHPNIREVKPYLRPMSSMTADEEKEFLSLRCGLDVPDLSDAENLVFNTDSVDWLNENHFDYRGLIPMGLALEAPEGMYEF